MTVRTIDPATEQPIAERGQFAELITREIGKPITEALAEVAKSAAAADHYALREFTAAGIRGFVNVRTFWVAS